MKYLLTQEEFEQLIGKQPSTDPLPRFTVVYFTATWCGACRALDMNRLETSFPAVNWLKCDVDQNNYTPGYCQVRAIPTFLIVADTKILGTLKSNNTDQVASWITTTYDSWLSNTIQSKL
jgi:thioredoxin-like negative regulator of GroEL